jgi:DNA-directed RNA polymerase specialized sigma24 family protein
LKERKIREAHLPLADATIDMIEALADVRFSDREAQVVALVVNRAMNTQEVAEAIGVGESSVRTTLGRACTKIAEYMSDESEGGG